ncbi:MAG: hypothetical protein RIK87_09595 [Fuerstiella sp.]
MQRRGIMAWGKYPGDDRETTAKDDIQGCMMCKRRAKIINDPERQSRV